MSNLTTETLIIDAMFALGIDTNTFTGTNKTNYLNYFKQQRRLLIADKKMANTMIRNQKLQSAVPSEQVGGESGWYYQPSDLCQYAPDSVPAGICMLPRVPAPSIVVEKTKAIKIPSGQISYYADTEYYEALPAAFVTLLSWKMKEFLAIQFVDTKGSLIGVISSKVLEATGELNKAKISEQNNKNSITNIPVFTFKSTEIAV